MPLPSGSVFSELANLYTVSRRDCWGADSGLGLLERTLSSRKASAPSGSYTARLFGDKVQFKFQSPKLTLIPF